MGKPIDLTIRQVKIGYTDADGPGYCQCWVSQFHNALTQVRQIAWDGVRWFVMPDTRSRYRPVGESEVPEHVKERFRKHVRK